MKPHRVSAFIKLWVGQTVSLLGSQITFLALPLLAALTLRASPFEMGLLSAIGTLPALLVALPGGVWVDRGEARPYLIVSDLARWGLLSLIPVSAWFGWLNLPLLYVISFLTGIFNIVFEIAYRAYLPRIVEAEALVAGNSKLEISRSLAEIAGPGLAGLLVQSLSAAFAILIDALSFGVSAFLLIAIKPEHSIDDKTTLQVKASLWAEVKDGLKALRHNKVLLILLFSMTGLNLFNHILEAVWILFAIGELRLEAGWLGLVFGAGNIGFMVGAVWTAGLSQRFGMGQLIAGGLLLVAFGDAFIVLAGGPFFLIISMLFIAEFSFGFGLTLYNINQVSLRQLMIPPLLLGRVNSIFTLALRGISPVGALIGGGLGVLIGLRPTLAIAVAGELVVALIIAFSPVWRLKQPAKAEPD